MGLNLNPWSDRSPHNQGFQSPAPGSRSIEMDAPDAGASFSSDCDPHNAFSEMQSRVRERLEGEETGAKSSHRLRTALLAVAACSLALIGGWWLFGKFQPRVTAVPPESAQTRNSAPFGNSGPSGSQGGNPRDNVSAAQQTHPNTRGPATETGATERLSRNAEPRIPDSTESRASSGAFGRASGPASGTDVPQESSFSTTDAAAPTPRTYSTPSLQTGDTAGYQPAVLIQKPDPAYPPEARDQRIQGTVRVNATVGKDGVPRKFKVLSGDAVLAHAVLDALLQWRYKPALSKGEPVETQVVISIDFSLDQ